MGNGNTIPEKWYWIAVYQNGDLLYQYKDNGTKIITVSFYDIDQSKLKMFVLVEKDGNRSFQMNFDPQKMKLIFYWTRFGNIGGVRNTIYNFGYQIKGTSTKIINKVTENGASYLESVI